jgi:hypothetical protein
VRTRTRLKGSVSSACLCRCRLGSPRQVNTSSRHTIVPNCASKWCQLVFANCRPMLPLGAWLRENKANRIKCFALRRVPVRSATRCPDGQVPCVRHSDTRTHRKNRALYCFHLFRFAPVHFAQRNWNLTVRKSYSPGSQLLSFTYRLSDFGDCVRLCPFGFSRNAYKDKNKRPDSFPGVVSALPSEIVALAAP